MDKRTAKIIKKAWDEQAAAANLERWLSICASEGWENTQQELNTLTLIFGASWYFTRFIYFRGIDIMPLLDNKAGFEPGLAKLLATLKEIANDRSQTTEEYLQQFRIRKNECMLYVLAYYIHQRISQQQMEHALTCVADVVISGMISLFDLNRAQDEQILMLGMGRLAGYEMSYGSDLDLIFVARSEDKFFEQLAKKKQRLLRAITQHHPSGYLYDIDMRLRPHGHSGTLITAFDQFIAFHQQKRAVWERQMMTRHRIIYSSPLLSERLEGALIRAVYRRYSQKELRTEILDMRMRVEQDLGRPRGKYEVKRGVGGIMDIDFITHYYQLAHGYEMLQLQTASTRDALTQIAALHLIKQDQADDLIRAYDYLKRVECILRVFDMKSVSHFSSDADVLLRLARATGHFTTSKRQACDAFLSEYQHITRAVRAIFNMVFCAK